VTIMEKLVGWMVLAGETEVLGENLLSTTNPSFQTRARTWAAAVGSQRLTASVMARSISQCYACFDDFPCLG
jgi:hypothetical protein